MEIFTYFQFRLNMQFLEAVIRCFIGKVCKKSIISIFITNLSFIPLLDFSALSKTSKQKSAALQVSTSEDEDVDVGMMDVVVDTISKKGGGVSSNKSGAKANNNQQQQHGPGVCIDY